LEWMWSEAWCDPGPFGNLTTDSLTGPPSLVPFSRTERNGSSPGIQEPHGNAEGFRFVVLPAWPWEREHRRVCNPDFRTEKGILVAAAPIPRGTGSAPCHRRTPNINTHHRTPVANGPSRQEIRPADHARQHSPRDPGRLGMENAGEPAADGPIWRCTGRREESGPVVGSRDGSD
jgi:hypothetical protein